MQILTNTAKIEKIESTFPLLTLKQVTRRICSYFFFFRLWISIRSELNFYVKIIHVSYDCTVAEGTINCKSWWF